MAGKDKDKEKLHLCLPMVFVLMICLEILHLLWTSFPEAPPVRKGRLCPVPCVLPGVP